MSWDFKGLKNISGDFKKFLEAVRNCKRLKKISREFERF